MDGSSDTPQYMGAWMKHKYGNWIDCPVIEQLGIYPLLPLQYQENSCFRINSPNSNNEFFVVEYRNKSGLYEINTPGNASGMLVYRINGNLNGNADGDDLTEDENLSGDQYEITVEDIDSDRKSVV